MHRATVLFLVLSSALAACSTPSASDAPPRTVAIAATATLHVPPDTAAVTLTFRAEDTDLAVAHELVDSSRRAFLSQVESFEARVESGNVDYQPYRTQWMSHEEFRASQAVVVHTHEFTDIPQIIRLGGAQLGGVRVRYYVEDMVQHRSRIRQMAIEAAGSKASELAEGFDVELGGLLSVEEGGATTGASGAVGNFDNVFVRVSVTDPQDGPPPPGAIPLRVTLHVTYAIET